MSEANGTRVKLPQEQRNEIREFVRTLRTAHPELRPADALLRVESRFGVEIAPTNFGATYWRQAEPEVEEEQPAPATCGVNVELYDDGTARLHVDLVDRAATIFAAVAAIGDVFASHQSNVAGAP